MRCQNRAHTIIGLRTNCNKHTNADVCIRWHSYPSWSSRCQARSSGRQSSILVESIPTTALLPRIGSGPLQDISNSSRHMSNVAYLLKVSEKWTAGKGKRQTNQCQAAIRLCLMNGLQCKSLDMFQLNISTWDWKFKPESIKGHTIQLIE